MATLSTEEKLLEEARKENYSEELRARYEQVHAAILAGPNSELQELIDSGVAWRLEGSVGRSAAAALEVGACVLPEDPIKDYYGNTVPAHWMLKEGTKGTVLNAEEYDPKEY